MLARRYEIHVRGILPERVVAEICAELPTLEVHTVLSGLVRDQAELQGLLRRLHNLGLELLELRQVPEEPAPVPPADSASRGEPR